MLQFNRGRHRAALIGATLCALSLLAPPSLFAAPLMLSQVPVQLPPGPETPVVPTQPAAPSATSPSLTQGVWLWIRTEYSDDSTLRSPDPNAYTLAFMDDGRLTIEADCNTVMTTYILSGSALTIQPGAATLVACPPGSQDTVFLRDVMQVVTYAFDGPQLVLNLRLDSGNMIFSPQSPTALTGPTWRVTSYNNGVGGVVTTAAGTQVSMMFGSDGTVTGDTGCNTFNATYVPSGSRISFGPIASTRRACPSDAANQQEQRFLAALSASTMYELAGDRLTFRDDRGATQIIAVRPTVEPAP